MELIKGISIVWCSHYPEGLKAPEVCNECEKERKDLPNFIVTEVTEKTVTVEVSPEEKFL